VLNWIVNIIPMLVVLGVLIFVHELGHFIACRICGVRVDKFSIGFGPEIIRWKTKRTHYAISLIPFGGFVKPGGETSEDIEEGGLDKDDYLAQGAGKRFFIVVSGAVMNYIFGFLLFVAIFFVGHPVLSSVVGNLVDGYPAQEAGIMKDDRITSVNEIPVSTWTDLTTTLQKTEGDTLKVSIERDGRMRSITIRPTIDEAKDVFGETKRVVRIGIYPSQEAVAIEKYSLVESFGKSADAVLGFTVITYKAIFYLITGKLSLKAVTGPVGIMAMASQTARLGIIYLMQLMAIISISLAIFNLLPIPALDGGHILFIAIEKVRGKAISFKVQERITQIGFILLMVLMVVVVYNDVVRLDFVGKICKFFVK